MVISLRTSATQTPSDLPEPEPEPASLPCTPEQMTASWVFSILWHEVEIIEPTKAFHRTTSPNCSLLPARIYQRESGSFSKFAPKLRMNLLKVWWADHGVVMVGDPTYKGCEFTHPADMA
ncbi:hypothetical protein DL765_011071 [Monosporascus sp. GIB2]|nr:hypothetical protein DL765_011071 [Monosporascus sp. GIB2]